MSVAPINKLIGSSGVTAGSFTNASVTINSQGFVTAASNGSGGGSGTVTSVASGTGLSGGPITSTGTLALTNTSVTAGSYTSANITVDAQGRITSASNGSGGGGGGSGTVTSVASGTGLSGGPITSTGTLSLANTAVTPGSYINSSVTVDAQGRITAASNGTGVAAGRRRVVYMNTTQSISSGNVVLTFNTVDPVSDGTFTDLTLTQGTLGGGNFSAPWNTFTNNGSTVLKLALQLTIYIDTNATTPASAFARVTLGKGASAGPIWPFILPTTVNVYNSMQTFNTVMTLGIGENFQVLLQSTGASGLIVGHTGSYDQTSTEVSIFEIL